ncbi:hypothetical protein DSL92_05230 [Billgrantia gudaonensis]|uniref:Uncharacterized protein n=1 Tax=Billgrantia gudaonensis TaxID=376427 RepID=A0A432JK59_9GAMM|nr:hypothetical protein DSL92_05230 [Halomonas gudaonensis]
MRLTVPASEVLHRYESDSLRPSPLFLVMVLEGQVGVRLGDHALLNRFGDDGTAGRAYAAHPGTRATAENAQPVTGPGRAELAGQSPQLWHRAWVVKHR